MDDEKNVPPVPKPTASTCREVYLPIFTAGTALLLLCLGFSWVFAVLPQYYVDLSCLKLYNETFAICHNSSNSSSSSSSSVNPRWNNVTVSANNEGSVIALTTSIMQAITCPMWCTLADTVGRKWMLVFCGLLLAVFQIGVALIPHELFYTYGVYLAALSGLSGGLYCFLALTFATVADITAGLSPKQRTSLFGAVESMLWVGISAGPIISTLAVDLLSPDHEAAGMQQTFFVGAGSILLAVLIIVTCTKETLRKKKKLSWASINPIAGLFAVKTWDIAFIGASNAVMLVASSTATTVLPLYLLTYFSSSQEYNDQSYILSIYFASSAFGLFFVLPLLSKCISQRAIMLISAAMTCVTWTLYAFPQVMWLFFLVAASCFANGLMFPVVRTFLTRSLGPAHFGNALGLLAFLQELSSLVAPLLKVAVWDLEVQVGFKGLSFLLFGAIGLLGFVFSLAVKFPKDSIDDATAQNAEHLVDVVAAGADGDPAHAEATKPDARSSSSCSQDAPLLLNDEGI